MDIIKVKPLFRENIWGGERLKTEFGYEIPSKTTGECWGVSAHASGDCSLEAPYEGKTLSSLWKDNPELFGRTEAPAYDFPLLMKIIDAKSDLSIQVHPNDEYARSKEHCPYGKTECWYVLDALPGSTLVVGHNAATREELTSMIENDEWKELIREVPVKAGDFIQIDPGTVHAIKGGILLYEAQQSSDITYRLYDYGRLWNGKPRELHIDKSIDVITVPAKDSSEAVVSAANLPANCLNNLITCDYYKVWKINVSENGFSFCLPSSFLIISVISGEGFIGTTPVSKGDHFIIPSGYGTVALSGDMELIATAE